MGLDIIPCLSLAWDRSLAAIEAFEDFNASVDFAEWFPLWHKEHGLKYAMGYREFHPMNFPENRARYNSSLMSYCELYGFQYREDSFSGAFVGRIDNGITELGEYAIRSPNNDGGANNILKSHGMMSLYELFGIRDEGVHDYHIIDFPAVRNRAKALLDEWEGLRRESKEWGHVDETLRLILRFIEVFRINGYSRYRLLWLN